MASKSKVELSNQNCFRAYVKQIMKSQLIHMDRQTHIILPLKQVDEKKSPAVSSS